MICGGYKTIPARPKSTPPKKRYRWYDVSDSYPYPCVYRHTSMHDGKKKHPLLAHWHQQLQHPGGRQSSRRLQHRHDLPNYRLHQNPTVQWHIASLSWRAPLGTCHDIQGHHFRYDVANRLRVPLFGSAVAEHLR